MAYVTIPKDLTKVKSKVLFGLTRRQLICFGAAVLVGVPLFFAQKSGGFQRGHPLHDPGDAALLPAGYVRKNTASHWR